MTIHIGAPRGARTAFGAGKAPGEVQDLDGWKLQLPVDAAGGFVGPYIEVKDLDDYASAWFYAEKDGAVVLTAPVEGATTGGSTTARAELREMEAGGEAAWTAAEGGRLEVTMSVDEVPIKVGGAPSKVCVGQVHDGTFQLVRLYYENGTLHWVMGRNEAAAERRFAIVDAMGRSPDVALGEDFTYRIDVGPGGVAVTVEADGRTYTSQAAIGAGWEGEEYYFKAGVYLNTNETNSTGAGRVSILDIEAMHGDAATDRTPVGPTSPAPAVPGSPTPPPASPAPITDKGVAAALLGTGADDLFAVGHKATVVQGGAGVDTVRATVSWTMTDGVERLELGGSAAINGTGGAGNDAILGNAAANRLKGEGGDDSLQGEGGDDAIAGGTGSDALSGGVGRDSLAGGAGDDRLDGGDGADRVEGGTGTDRLTGGGGGDAFVFRSINDSKPGGSDLVADFASGVDVIDLSLIDANTRVAGDQAFVWDGSGAGQLVQRGGHLLADVNGDGRMDLDIDLGGRTVTVSDLLL